MADTDELLGYVEIWRLAIEDFLEVLRDVPDDQWDLPTDLPGWTVQDVAAHIAHLESMAIDRPHDDVEIGSPDHVKSPLGTFTEQGVVARKQRTPAELIEEIREATTERYIQLTENPPTDASTPANGVFGAIGWNWRTLLRNRPLDVWLHEQDIRRAIGRPGNLHSAAADHTVDYLLSGLGYVLAKKVAAAPGSSVVISVEGTDPIEFEIDENGRGIRLPSPSHTPTVGMALGREAYVVLAAGRRQPDADSVQITGDRELGQRIVDHLATTP